MPTYSVTISGKTYSFDGPAGLPNEDVYATIQAGHPDAFAPPKDTPVSDFGSYLKQGALGATQNVFDVTGIHNPVSDWMGRQQEGIKFSEAEQARQQRAAEIKKEAEGKGAVAGGLAALHAFGVDWKSLTGQAIGSLAPVALPFLGAGAAAVAAPEVAAAVGIGTIAEAGSAALGLAMGAGGMKRGMYQAVKETLLEHKVDEDKAEEAATKASEYTGPNAAFIAGGGLLGIIDSVTGVGNRAANAIATRVAAKVVGKEAAEKGAAEVGEKVAGAAVGEAASEATSKASVKGLDEDAKKKAEEKIGHAILKDMVKEAGTEAAENAFQQVGQNVAQTNAGVQTSPWEGVAEQAVEGAIGGGLAGGLATGVLQGGNRASMHMLKAAADATATATPGSEKYTAPPSPEVRAAMDAGLSRENAELSLAYVNKTEGPGAAAPAGTNTVEGVQPIVRGTEPDVQGAGRRDAAAGVAPATAQPATGGLETTEQRPSGFTGTTSFDDRPLREQKAERKANPITPEYVKTGLDNFVVDNNLGITVPDPFVKRVTAAANAAHVAGEPKTLAEIIEQVTPKFEPPKDIGQTVLSLQPAIAQLGGLPTGVTLNTTDVQAIHDQLVVGRGLVTPAKALDNVISSKMQVLEAPPAPPAVTPPNPVAEQVHATLDTPLETSSQPPVDTAIGEKTVADADIKAQTDPSSIPGTETQKAELADAIASDKTSPNPVLDPQLETTVEQAVAQGGDPAIYKEELDKAKVAAVPREVRAAANAAYDAVMANVPATAKPAERRAAVPEAMKAYNDVLDAATAPPALAEAQPSTPDQAQPAQEPVSQAPPEAQPPLPANLAAMMPGEPPAAAEAPVAGEPVQAGAPAAGEPVQAGAPVAAETAPGEIPITPAVQAAVDAVNAVAENSVTKPEAAAADLVAIDSSAKAQMDEQVAREDAADATKPPPGSKAAIQQTAEKLPKQGPRARSDAKRAGEQISANTYEGAVKAAEALSDGVSTHDETVVDGMENVDPKLTEENMPGLFNEAGYPQFKKLVDPLMTSRIRKLFGKALPHLRPLYNLTGQAQAFRIGLLRGFDKVGRDFKAYVKQHTSVVLANAISVTKSMRVNPLDHVDRADAQLNDPVKKRYTEVLSDPKLMKENRITKKQLEANLKERTEEIDVAYDAWEKLLEQNGGREMYERIKNFHKYTSNMVKMLRDKTVKAMGLQDTAAADRLIKFMNEQMDPESYTSKNGKDMKYRLMDAKDMPKVYFPSKRYGEYWVGIKEGASGREYYQYDTHRQMKAAIKRFEDYYGPRSKVSGFIESGDRSTQLRESMTKESAVVQEIMRKVEEFPVNGKTDEIRNRQRERLRDAVFQTYLQSLPDRSLSKNMIHYEDITGASEDILRNFGTVSHQLANLMTSLNYGSQADILFRSAASYIRPDEGMPRRFSRETTMKLEYILSKVHERLMLAINPPPRSGLLEKLITIGNRAGVVWMMSSAGTAFANMTAIPVRVAPRLLADHGPRAIAMMTNLMDLTGTISVKDRDGNLAMPNMMNSPYVKGNADRRKGMDIMDRMGIFESSYDTQIGPKPSNVSGPREVAAEVSRIVTKAATFGIAATEVLSRQQAGLMAFDLQLPKELKKGGTHEEAVIRAAEYAADVVDDTIGNFSVANYPKFISQGVGRALFLFKRFSFIQSDFQWGAAYEFVRAATNAIKGKDTAANAKLAALSFAELGTSMGMVTFFAGLAGLPMYSMIMGLADWKDDKFLTPEEKAARVEMYGDAAFSADLRLRYHDLPQWLGHATMVGPDGFRHGLANVIMNGPFSELTDANIGNRVSIDHLWFRGLQQGNNLGEVALNTFVANVANISLATNMMNGVQDIEGGEGVRGMEKLMPAGLKGLFSDYRYMTEGARTRNQYDLLKPEDFTLPNLIATVGGVQPTKLANIQQARIAIQDVAKGAKDDENKVMAKFRKGWVDYDRDPRILDDAIDEVIKHNNKYPLEAFQIDAKALVSSITTLDRNQADTLEGTTLSKKNIIDLLPTVEASAPVQGGLPSDYARH